MMMLSSLSLDRSNDNGNGMARLFKNAALLRFCLPTKCARRARKEIRPRAVGR
jgi:hypothetical protein